MTQSQAKAEADKIIEEFYPNSSFDEIAQNSDEAAKENAIIHVKGIIKQTKLFFCLPELEHWNSILSQLMKK